MEPLRFSDPAYVFLRLVLAHDFLAATVMRVFLEEHRVFEHLEDVHWVLEIALSLKYSGAQPGHMIDRSTPRAARRAETREERLGRDIANSARRTFGCCRC